MTNASKPDRFPMLAAGVSGLIGVGIGAMGAHALKAVLIERGMLQAWETGSRYHLFHAVALLGIAAWLRHSTNDTGNRLLTWTAALWCFGTLLFSGSLYWLALGGPRWLGPVTPLGGVALMAGWLLIALAAFAKRS
jgi:uncharacterized membrane protein YgdD (TMEM256/DUF423 family)